MVISADEAGFLAAIRANKADDLPRLVYADWLDEHGRHSEAETIRVQIELEPFIKQMKGADVVTRIGEWITNPLARRSDELVMQWVEKKAPARLFRKALRIQACGRYLVHVGDVQEDIRFRRGFVSEASGVLPSFLLPHIRGFAAANPGLERVRMAWEDWYYGEVFSDGTTTYCINTVGEGHAPPIFTHMVLNSRRDEVRGTGRTDTVLMRILRDAFPGIVFEMEPRPTAMWYGDGREYPVRRATHAADRLAEAFRSATAQMDRFNEMATLIEGRRVRLVRTPTFREWSQAVERSAE
ncbi:TIGR02996 domain-containing protein [Fimbriiglobus ruber]|uniref:TIGR02996 domain-containing protein n=1 Tax=Fimbriiglobus ruber TaxID=1908690 RepID=A0A225DAZ6_9BACT|nr:TIGR02996 domain-containing protein [Fimbriiglobus ruber]OWK34309.1 hypothetical protein FRUB_10280 [Fimbriiglobus ruber]